MTLAIIDPAPPGVEPPRPLVIIENGENTAEARRQAVLAALSAVAAATSASAAGAHEEAAEDAAALAQLAITGAYADTTAGLAGTANGGLFLVWSTGDVYASLYRDNAGVAELLNEIPAASLTRKAHNPLLMSKAENHGWEDFDRPEGTLASAFGTSKSGHAFTISGAGAATALISGNGLTSPGGNIYFNPGDDPGVVTQVWGVFAFDKDGTGLVDDGQQAVLMFNGEGPIELTGGLIHVEFIPNGVSAKISLTGAGALVPITGTSTEVDNAPGIARLPLDAIPRLVGLRFVQKGAALDDELYIYRPDGKVSKIVGNSDMRTVMATCQWATGQIAGDPVTNGWLTRWHGIAQGPRRAEVAAALGGHLPDARITKQLTGLRASQWELKRRVLIKPSATGWYTIATHDAALGPVRIGGEMRFYGADNAGRASAGRVVFGLEASQKMRIDAQEFPVGFWSGDTQVTRFRVSRTNHTAYQLDVYVASFVDAAIDAVAIDLTGMFTVVENPVVGASPLATATYERVLQLPRRPSNLGGNANFTLTPGIDNPNVYLASATSPDKTITLDDTKAIDGDRFFITRLASAANGYNVVNLTGGALIKNLPSGSWGLFVWNGTLFYLAAYGTL